MSPHVSPGRMVSPPRPPSQLPRLPRLTLRDFHCHSLPQVDLWSAVYYVNEGEPNAPGFGFEQSGHMIFRAGPRPTAEGGPCASSRSSSSATQVAGEECEAPRTFFAVPPTAGTLWLFPGSMPHTVMPTVLPPGAAEPETPRISIGVNFEVAVPPLPRPWRPPLTPDARRALAETASQAEAAQEAAEQQQQQSGSRTVGGSEQLARSDSNPSPFAAKESGKIDNADDEESSPFLMLSGAEALEAGFREDEEVVMPMPVFSDSDSDGE